ncbi:MAG: hypothetical protein JXB18_04200 [Sedimentisphaerales bacterium]|nr:hypothetical protein [Sedimentisphaerales bacterium]
MRHMEIISYIIVIGLTGLVYADTFELRFSAVIQDESEDVLPGSFAALGYSNIPTPPFSLLPLKQPPPPPSRSYVQIVRQSESVEWIRESQAYDSEGIDLLYSMALMGHDANEPDLAGKSILTLHNPEVLAQIPRQSLLYLRRYDRAGSFVQSYDLLNPANHIIEWDAADAVGRYASFDLLLLDKCLAADLVLNDFIDFHDFTVLAAQWQNTGHELLADIYWDDKVDILDLSILAEQWLCSCLD